MSTDENISEQLSAYLDGELSDSQVRRVEAALRDDPALARELERLRATRELVRSLPMAKAPEGFTAAVMEEAERSQLVAPAPAAGRWSHWSSLVAVAVVLVAVGIGVVITISVTMAPSWSDKFTRGRPRSERVAVAPAAEDKLEVLDEGTKGSSRGTVVTSSEEVASRHLGLADAKAPAGAAGEGRLDVVAGSADISAGYAMPTDRPSDEFGTTNVDFRYEKRDKLAAAKPESPATLPSVDQISEMPAVAAAPGPRADRRPGVVTQVGEPLYRPPTEAEEARLAGEADEQRGTILPTAQPAVGGAIALAKEVAQEEMMGRARRLHGTMPEPPTMGQPTSRPTTAATSQPASAPTTQPTSAPATQPTSQPVK